MIRRGSGCALSSAGQSDDDEDGLLVEVLLDPESLFEDSLFEEESLVFSLFDDDESLDELELSEDELSLDRDLALAP